MNSIIGDKAEFGEKYQIICNKIEERDGIKEGAHVRYIGIDDEFLEFSQSYFGNPSDPRGILDFDSIYEIECRIIARSWSKVKLVGFREYEFSPSIFEAIDKNQKKKSLKAGGHVRYIGPIHEVLNFESIYEVENVFLHFSWIEVILVGFKEGFDRRLFEKL